MLNVYLALALCMVNVLHIVSVSMESHGDVNGRVFGLEASRTTHRVFGLVLEHHALVSA